ncbi:hypothetical protein [Rhodococcus jostii]|jgi:hypothetical protein|uniref:hypothetical protein n=1 Tax=Rhodococcus jostii TaxID=132919 RepID=UPI00032385D6|nr:hypothetical protein [Rhodococcus jostii]
MDIMTAELALWMAHRGLANAAAAREPDVRASRADAAPSERSAAWVTRDDRG